MSEVIFHVQSSLAQVQVETLNFDPLLPQNSRTKRSGEKTFAAAAAADVVKVDRFTTMHKSI